MQGTSPFGFWDRLYALARSRAVWTAAQLGLVVLGPVLAFLTFLALGPLDKGGNSPMMRLVITADLLYVLVVAVLVFGTVLRVYTARRRQSSGSRLHLRLSGIFAVVALVPAVLVALFAVLTINIGLEGWFSERVRNVVGASKSAAEAYEHAQRRDLITDAEAVAARISLAWQAGLVVNDGDLRQMLTQEQAHVQRGLREAFLIDGTGEIRARGDRSYLFDFEPPPRAELERARQGETVVIKDWQNNEFRAIVPLPAYLDRLLYVSRNVDGALLHLLDETQESVRLYTQLEADRGKQLFQFGLLYLGFALILVLAAVWMGLWIAERLARPVGALATAVARVGDGDFDVKVVAPDTRDEIATLGHSFNRMTRQLKSQNVALLASHQATDAQRRLFDSVLGSVTSGVIGLDADGHVDFLNRSARKLLDLSKDLGQDTPLEVLVPEFGALLARAEEAAAPVQEEIRVVRKGRMENLLVRIAPRDAEDGAREGFVVAFDDVTALVSAQRMAAWGDVARRIAHEIKNPLTPIQLSAERIRRRFGSKLDEENSLALENLVDVIVRQTGDLRRIVDEFSKFARMPEPETRDEDLGKLLRDAVLLQESGQPGVTFETDLPEAPLNLALDATMIGQALTNLIKNAGEAIETLQEKGAAPEGHVPMIRVRLVATETAAIIEIADNGAGLPEDRSRLFEPYVTTRSKGTGLGLPIVKKIIEEHGGSLDLIDAPLFGGTDRPGALAEIRLPLTASASRGRKGI